MQSLLSPRPQPFWSATTVRFAVAGLFCYLLSLAVPDSWPYLLPVSVARLAPLLLLLRDRRSWPVALATPLPFSLILAIYSERSRWAGEELAMEMSGPVLFIVIAGGLSLLSIPLSSWILSKSVRVPIDEDLRRVAILLFGITAVAAAIGVPQVFTAVMRYVAEPAAVIGYAAVLGKACQTGHNEN